MKEEKVETSILGGLAGGCFPGAEIGGMDQVEVSVGRGILLSTPVNSPWPQRP